MLKPEDNERITRVGPGTPMGELQRRYWVPFALASELPEPDGAPIRVRILGEDLVAFRATDGVVGLMDAFCPHRRAPMFFGRNEECGLRCVYHGWKFDRDGTCVDMPSEPADSLFKTKVTIATYPTWEGGGLLWTYMGPKEHQPPVPDYEFTRAPATHRHASKTFEECNWLQALEGGLDTSHSSFAHNLDIHDKSYLRSQDTAPRLEVYRTDYGYTYAGIRAVENQSYVRAYHYVMPAQQMRGRVTSRKGTHVDPHPTINGHIWVPIDDTHCWVFNWMYSYSPDIPITEQYALDLEKQYGRGEDDLIPGTFQLKKNLRNDYEIDRQLQKNKTFTGIEGVNTQDMALQEGMGGVVDRSKEHLGTSDRAIIVMRQLLMEALDDLAAGKPIRGINPQTYSHVRAVDLVIPAAPDWREALKDELVAKF
jgi:phenylpropionate dioxygenase-like ring-hydroxylating dioxygenase large terminal subunit